jgi:hypothetical protein
MRVCPQGWIVVWIADSPNEVESRERATIAAAWLFKNHDKTEAMACDGKWEPFKPSG